ncbi:hypothetical protein [Variovorax sp. ZT4R33]|uniref:hypothetical protein n=1 Tax=Variovorax sp. ZT4R33 TaxID=3443743 RepID=UPI003F47E169
MNAGRSVLAVHSSTLHSFSKFSEPAIRLVASLGVWRGDWGENITTRGLDLLALPAGPLQPLEPV